MGGLFDGTPLERPVTCPECEAPFDSCTCPRNAEGEITRPSAQQVRVSRERRGGGKLVTVITGLDPVASDARAILSKLKSMCAAGGTLADGKIEVQGDHRDKAVSLLKQMGYPTKLAGG